MLFCLNFMIFFILFFCGLMVFFFNYKFLLINLLSLEYMVLSLFMFLYIYFLLMNCEMYFSMVFLTFCVCEGVMGLSLLISMVRGIGNNYLQSLNIFLC